MRGLAGRALVETMMIGRRAGTSRRRDAPSTRRETSYKEAGLQGEGSGRRAGVGVVVAWKQVMRRTQRCWSLRRILAC